MPYARLALFLAILTAAIGLGELVYFRAGYLPRQWLPIILWAAVPAPLFYWLASLVVRSVPAARIVCTALGLALALGAYGAWDVTLGPGRDESLSGLILIGVPVYQNALFLAGRRLGSRAARSGRRSTVTRSASACRHSAIFL
jgi:hypothetical protein